MKGNRIWIMKDDKVIAERIYCEECLQKAVAAIEVEETGADYPDLPGCQRGLNGRRCSGCHLIINDGPYY